MVDEAQVDMKNFGIPGLRYRGLEDDAERGGIGEQIES